MSRKEDLLFCKIAISTGLVSPEQAQKVLSICDKREKEAGRRPLIGPVFSKYNLLKTQEVQRIYDAVGKRMGTPVGSQRLRVEPKKGNRRGTALVDRRQKPSRPVDPTTLWMGIGGLVIFLGIVCTMVYLVMRPGGETTKAGGASGSDVVSSSESSTSSADSAKSAPASKVVPPVKEAPRAELPMEIQGEVDSLIADAKSFISDDPQRGLSALEKMEGQLRSKHYEPPQKLLAAIQELREAVKQAGSTPEEGSSESKETPEAKAEGSEAAPPAQ